MATVEVIIGHYHDLVGYLGTRDCCNENYCSSILLGQLVREMVAQGIFNPRPTRPFLGLSVRDSIRMTFNIKSPNWESLGSSSSHLCDLKRFFGNYMVNLQADLKGLDLDNFIGHS